MRSDSAGAADFGAGCAGTGFGATGAEEAAGCTGAGAGRSGSGSRREMDWGAAGEAGAAGCTGCEDGGGWLGAVAGGLVPGGYERLAPGGEGLAAGGSEIFEVIVAGCGDGAAGVGCGSDSSSSGRRIGMSSSAFAGCSRIGSETGLGFSESSVSRKRGPFASAAGGGTAAGGDAIAGALALGRSAVGAETAGGGAGTWIPRTSAILVPHFGQRPRRAMSSFASVKCPPQVQRKSIPVVWASISMSMRDARRARRDLGSTLCSEDRKPQGQGQCEVHRPGLPSEVGPFLNRFRTNNGRLSPFSRSTQGGRLPDDIAMNETMLRAGVAQVEITPPMGIEMAGYGWYIKRLCTAVLDPLHARALYLQCGATEFILITADVITVDPQTHRAVASQLKARCGLEEHHLMIAASHTHSGPSTQRLIAWGGPDPQYMATLTNLYVQVALDARARAAPARLGAVRQRVHGVGINREQPLIGPIDTAAQLLRVDRADGSPVAALFNFGAHPVVRYPFTSRISADWPGLVEAEIRAKLPGVTAMFLQGACGNINGHEMTFERKDIQQHERTCDMRAGDTAKRLTDQILPALQALETTSLSAPFQILRDTIELPCVSPDKDAMEQLVRENQPLADSRTHEEMRPLHERLLTETKEEIDWRTARWKVDSARHQLDLLARPPHVHRVPVQVVRLGDAVMVGWSGEVFVELGLELRQRSPFPLTFVGTFVNDSTGYIPTEAAYESKGRPNQFGHYPRELTPLLYGHLPYRADVGRVLVGPTMKMLNRLASGASS